MSFCEKGFTPNKCEEKKRPCKPCHPKFVCLCQCFPVCEEKRPCDKKPCGCSEVKRHRPDCEKEKKFPCCCEKDYLPVWWEEDEKRCGWENEYEWKNPCCCEREYYSECEKNRKPQRMGYYEENEEVENGPYSETPWKF